MIVYRSLRLVGDRTTATIAALPPEPVSLSWDGGRQGPVREGDRLRFASPPGEWVLRTGASFLASTLDTVDLGTTIAGREGIEWVDAGVSSLRLAATGLSPWAAGDDLLFLSLGAGLEGRASRALLDTPSPGVPPTELTLDYGALAGNSSPRVSAAQGDVLRVVQLEFVEPGGPDAGVSCLVAGPATITHAFEVDAGLALAFDPATPASIARPAAPVVEARFVHPRATPAGGRWATFAEAFPGAPLATIADCSWVDGAAPSGVWASDPWPAAWSRDVQHDAFWVVTRLLPGLKEWTVRASASRRRDPGVQPPSALQVDHVAAEDLFTFLAAQPVSVAWAAPAGVPPTDYEVVLVELSSSGGEEVVAKAVTRATHFTFPAGLLRQRVVYAVKVRARATNADEWQLLRGPVFSWAEAVTNPFLAQ